MGGTCVVADFANERRGSRETPGDWPAGKQDLEPRGTESANNLDEPGSRFSPQSPEKNKTLPTP